MPNSVGDVFLNLQLNTKPFEKSLETVSSGNSTNKIGAQINNGIAKGMGKHTASLNALANTLGGNWGSLFGKAAGGAAVLALAKFIKKGLALNSAFHAVSDMAERAFPNMSAEVEAFTKTALNNFGLSETSALRLVSTFGVMANSMGMTEEQAFEMSKTLSALSGDMASFYHISVEEAQNKLEGIFSGQTRSLRQLGIVMSEASLSQFALAQGYSKTYNEMTELEKVQLRYLFVLDRTKLAQGDALRYTHAYGNEVRKLKQNFEQFQISLAEGFRGIVTPILTWLNMILVKLQQLAAMWSAWIKRIQAPFKAVKGLGGLIQGALGKATTEQVQDLDDSVAGVSDSVDGVGDSAKGAKKQVKELRRELLGFDRIIKLTKQDADTGTSGDSGVGGGVGGLGGLDIGSSYVNDYDTSLLEDIKIPPALSAALEKLGNAFEKLFRVFKDIGKWVLDNVLRPFADWFKSSMLPALLENLAPIIRIIALVLDELFAVVKILWEFIKPIVKWVGKVLVNSLKRGAKALEYIVDILEWWWSVLKPIFELIIKKVQEAWETVETAFRKVKRLKFFRDLKKKMQEFKKGIAKFLLKPLEFFMKALQALGRALDALFGEGTAKSLGLDFKVEDLQNLHDQLEEFSQTENLEIDLTGVVYAIEDAVPTVKKVIKNLSGSIEKVKNSLPTSSKTLTGFTASISKKVDKLTTAGHTITGMIASFTKRKVGSGFDATITGMVSSFSRWVKGSGFDNYISMTAYLTGVEMSSSAKAILRAITGKADGGVYSGGKWRPIQNYAVGGLPNQGQLFVAREAGAELVGTLGGHTAVMNNDQIVASVSAGVARAISNIKFIAKNATPRVVASPAAMGYGRTVNNDNDEIITLLKTLITEVKNKKTTVALDGRDITRAVVSNVNKQTRMTGTSPLII